MCVFRKIFRIFTETGFKLTLYRGAVWSKKIKSFFGKNFHVHFGWLTGRFHSDKYQAFIPLKLPNLVVTESEKTFLRKACVNYCEGRFDILSSGGRSLNCPTVKVVLIGV